jgi:hypothetical protein
MLLEREAVKLLFENGSRPACGSRTVPRSEHLISSTRARCGICTDADRSGIFNAEAAELANNLVPTYPSVVLYTS